MDETVNPKALKFGLIFGGILLIGIIIAIILTRPTNESMYKQLKNGDLEDKKDAIAYFVENGDDFAITALSEALHDQDPFVRIAAAGALGNLNSEKSIELLTDVLYHDNTVRVRDAALQSLTHIGGKTCADLLVPALEDDTVEIKLNAITALGKIGDESHAELLVKLLSNPNGSVSDATVEALITMGSKAIPALATELNNPETLRSTTQKIVQILCSIDDPQADSALAARCKGDPQFVADNYKLFIQHGREGDEAMLIEALMTYGTVSMAENYLNCGNEQLEDAAQEWADQNGYYIVSYNFNSSSADCVWGQN